MKRFTGSFSLGVPKPFLLVERDWEAVVAKGIAVFDAGAYHLTEVMTKLSFEVNTTTSLEEKKRLWKSWK